MEDEHTLQLFQDSVQSNDVESTYAHFTSLILRAARNAGMTVRRMPRRVRLGLPVAPWFDASCRALKAQINRHIKHSLPLTQLKHDYKSYCKSRKRAYLKQRAQDMVDLIDKHSTDIYKVMKAKKRVDTTPISADAWTAHLEQHFRQPVENDSRFHARLPTRHQALSSQLRSRLVLPSDLAVPPGPGGRFRQNAANPPLNNPQLSLPAAQYELPSVESLISYVQKNISRMNMDSSPGFEHFATPFIKKAERHYRDGRDKLRKENVLLSTLTDLFHLLLSSGVLPHSWFKTKITPLHKKGALSDPKNYRMLAINGCVYRLFSNVVRDLLTEWALAEHQIPDTQFGFCPTRNTNQPLFIIRHVLTCAKNKQKKVYAAFLDLLAAYDNVQRPGGLWDHLQNIGTPRHLLQTMMAMYRGSVYSLIDGDKISDEVAPDKGLKQG